MGMTVEELRQGFHRLVSRLYSDSFTRYRRDYFDALRRARTPRRRMAVP
jgi:hypothetical protein